MVHSSRKNYKSKLLSRDATVAADGLKGSEHADQVFRFIEEESLAKRQLSDDIIVVGEMAVDLVKVLDANKDIGRMRFAECQEVNDDVIGKKSGFDILDRVFTIMMEAEERITTYAEQMSALEASESGMRKKLDTISGHLEKASLMQHELYNVGRGATKEEIQAFRDAEEAGKKYTRTILNTTTNVGQAPISPPVTPKQVITPPAASPEPAKSTAAITNPITKKPAKK